MRIKFGNYAYADKGTGDRFKLYIDHCDVWIKDEELHDERVSILCTPTCFVDDNNSFSEFRIYVKNYCVPLLVFHTGGIISNGKLWNESRELIKQINEFIKEHKEKIDVDIQI